MTHTVNILKVKGTYGGLFSKEKFLKREEFLRH